MFSTSSLERFMMTKSNEIKGIVAAILAATIFGTHPTLVYFLRSEGMGILPTLFTGCIQCLLLYFILLAVTKNLGSIKVNHQQFWKIVLSSLLFYSTLWLLFVSFTKIPSGLATVIHFMYPIIVTSISVLTRREKLTKPLIIVILCTFVGVLLVSNPSNQNFNPVGILLAGLSALVYSSYIYMINDDSFKEINNTTFVFYISFIGGVVLLLGILFQSYVISTPAEVWGTYSSKVLIGALGFGLSQGIGVFLFATAVKYVGGPIGGALSAFEPLTAVLIGVCFFSERMSMFSVFGCVLILTSIVYLSYSKIKK
jgi:drug/metabolite transporter (DMT)-like permease